MIRYYLNSFKLDYQKTATRKEFFTVVAIDTLIFAKIILGMYLLKCQPHISYISFINPVISFFSNYRRLIHALVLLWTLIRHPFLVALMVRRFNAVRVNPNWMYVPFYRFYLCLQSDKK